MTAAARTPEVPGLTGLRVLARGGYATVYRAVQESVGREVAVKVETRTLESERDRRRFLREARAAGRMSSHPHVVDLFDAGVNPSGHPYLIMELCRGSYAERMRSVPLSPTEVRDVGVKIADALADAHSLGVLHRDVKPANLLITDFGEPALADFGLAILTEVRDTSITLDVLTPAYAAPEMFRSGPPAPAGDVYSLCATLYALMAGQPPRWPTLRDPSLVSLVDMFDLPIPDLPGAPAGLLELVRRGMSNHEADRPTAAELRDELLALELGVLTAQSLAPEVLTPPPAPPLPSSPVPSSPVPSSPVSGPSSSGGGSSSGDGRPGGRSGQGAPGSPGGPGGQGGPGGPGGQGGEGGPDGQGGEGAGGEGAGGEGHSGRGHSGGGHSGGGHDRGRHNGGHGGGHGGGQNGGGQNGGGQEVAAPRPTVVPVLSSAPAGPRREPARRRPSVLVLAAVGAGFVAMLAAATALGFFLMPAAVESSRFVAGSPPAPACPLSPPGEARCVTTAECFERISIAGAVVTPRPVACTESHVWEAFALGQLPAGLDNAPYTKIRQHTDVARVCSSANASLFSTEQAWQVEVLPPTRDQLAAGDRTFRCVAGRPPVRFTDSRFTP